MHGQPLGLLGPFMQMPITVPSKCPLGLTTAPPGDCGSTVVPTAGTQALPALASLLCTLVPSVHHKQAEACLRPSGQLLVGLQSQRQPRKPSSSPSSGAECFPLSVLCSAHHVLVYRPHNLTGHWAPWRLGLHLSWHPPKVHAWHRAGTQKRRRHEWSGRVAGPHQHQ